MNINVLFDVPALVAQGLMNGSLERVGAYQERSPLRVLLSAPHELYSESSVMGFCFVKSQSTRS